MIVTKDDIVLIILIAIYMAWSAYSNHRFLSKVDEHMKESYDISYSVIIRQARIEDSLDKILARQDSLMYICKHKKK
jgi:hypothetical protein